MEGHTYRYFNGDPLYPFGYGLSYSQFQYKEMDATAEISTQGVIAKIEVTVKNLGPLEAQEVTFHSIKIHMSDSFMSFHIHFKCG